MRQRDASCPDAGRLRHGATTVLYALLDPCVDSTRILRQHVESQSFWQKSTLGEGLSSLGRDMLESPATHHV